ncbi:GNAT family N-acetyltransferase [Nocardioides dilutus]
MSRKVVRLTLDNLAQLDEDLSAPCTTCLFWQLDPVSRARVPEGEAAAEKEAWVSHVLREWGSCGRIALVDERAVGYAIYAPPAFLPGAAAFPTAPVSPDAVLLSTVWVHPDHRGGGLGRMLVQGMARDLVRRGGIAAVEAFGDTRGPGLGASRRTCVVPADFLGSVGFKTHRPHGTTPRMRMDLRTALTWRTEVEAALERLVGAVRPAKPAPAPGEARLN